MSELYNVSGLQEYWIELWKDLLSISDIDIPSVPRLSDKTRDAFMLYNFLVMFLPNIAEDQMPKDWRLPNCDDSLLKLPGRWVAVETIAKSDWDNGLGYGNGYDPLARALGLRTRFNVVWDKLKSKYCPEAAKLLGLSEKAVRSFGVREWGTTANLFLELNKRKETSYPSLGLTRSWELSEDTHDSEGRFVTGHCGRGGSAAVYARRHISPNHDIGFRLIAVL